jgi:hypothetical protein
VESIRRILGKSPEPEQPIQEEAEAMVEHPVWGMIPRRMVEENICLKLDLPETAESLFSGPGVIKWTR